MNFRLILGRLTSLLALLVVVGAASLRGAETTFTVGTYNLENYVAEGDSNRPAKSDGAKRQIRESIRQLGADVLALQEIGRVEVLQELRASLKAEGLDYPHWEHVVGHDTNIFVAVLSKYPFTARRPHSKEGFLLQGRRFSTSRGIAEVDIQVAPNYSFTLLTTHLKSRRASFAADEAELREQEALVLREKVDERLRANPTANVVVLGDFNDDRNSRSTKAILGRGKTGLIDTRPAERNGDTDPNPNPRFAPRNVTWTHYYGLEDNYGRIDYILVSPGMAREWQPAGTFVLAIPKWGTASDHRPLVARFGAQDK